MRQHGRLYLGRWIWRASQEPVGQGLSGREDEGNNPGKAKMRSVPCSRASMHTVQEVEALTQGRKLYWLAAVRLADDRSQSGTQ